MQPRARLEDILCAYMTPLRLDLTAYSVIFASRLVGAVGPSRTIVDVYRAKDEKLEVAAKSLARSSRSIWLRDDGVLTIFLAHFLWEGCTCIFNAMCAVSTPSFSPLSIPAAGDVVG